MTQPPRVASTPTKQTPSYSQQQNPRHLDLFAQPKEDPGERAWREERNARRYAEEAVNRAIQQQCQEDYARGR